MYKLLHSKGNYKQDEKIIPQNGKKIVINKATDKGLISKIYKQLNKKRKKVQFLKNGQKI